MCLFAFSAQAEDVPPVLTGGVGEDERLELESQEKQYNLKLLFTGERGMYLSDVQVTITDKGKNVVVDTLTDGPILLAKLPAGRYTLHASVASFDKTIKLKLGDKLQKHSINFPVKDAPADIREYRKKSSINVAPTEPTDAAESPVEITDSPRTE
jgi:hypothetical protein